METIKHCTCKCGSTATSVHHTVTVPSFDDEGRFDGEDIIEYDEILCYNPDCDGFMDSTNPKRPLAQQVCDDDLPF